MKKDVCDWLRDFLRAGPREVSEVRIAAKAAGYTKGDLHDAKLICRIQSSNNWNPYDGQTNAWYWALPKEDT